MSGNKPRAIATINFKGGVGKTTTTWCLGNIVSGKPGNKVLLSDFDAQMSLTQAITLQEDGDLNKRFETWIEKSIAQRRTIFHAIDNYAKTADIGFACDNRSIYQINDSLHFVPAVEDLYWLDLDVISRDEIRQFVGLFLLKISTSSQLPEYKYAFFDCPPSFTLLSYSVLSCCDLILIPVNPDFYAVRGVSLILDSLRLRIEPSPIPKVAIFMNKAKPYSGGMTKESQYYWNEVRRKCREFERKGLNVKAIESPIYERASLKRAVSNASIPNPSRSEFESLWTELEGYINE